MAWGPYAHRAPDNCPACPCVNTALVIAHTNNGKIKFFTAHFKVLYLYYCRTECPKTQTCDDCDRPLWIRKNIIEQGFWEFIIIHGILGPSWPWSYGSWIYKVYAISTSAYHHWCCEFEFRSDGVYSIQHYVIKFVSDLRQVDGFLRALRFPPPIKLAATI